MQNKLLSHELRSSWKGFGIINLLLLITTIAGIPVRIVTETPGLVIEGARTDFFHIAVLTFVAVLAYGLYQLFRELFVAPSGLIFTVPAETESILQAKLKSSRLLTIGTLITLFALGIAFNYLPGGVFLVLGGVYLATCFYTVLLAAGFKCIAQSYRRGKDLTSAMTAVVAATLKGLMALGLYLVASYFLLGIAMMAMQIQSGLFVATFVLCLGVPPLIVAKGNMNSATSMLAGKQGVIR